MIKVSETLGWKKKKINNIFNVYFSGYFLNENQETTLNYLLNNFDLNFFKNKKFVKKVKDLKGNFGIIIEFNKTIIAITDKINSRKIYYSEKDGYFIFTNIPKNLQLSCDIDNKNINKSALLEIAMSGYTIDNKTIFQNLKKLGPAEIFIVDKQVSKINYFKFKNDSKLNSLNYSSLKNKFNDIILNNIENIIKSNHSRELVLSISAGKDSRLLASAFAKLGYKNLKLLSYGNPKAYESRIARQIAEKLSYKFIQVPLTIKSQKNFFLSSIFKEFKNNTNTFSSITFLQDISPFYLAKRKRLIDKNSIIINGNGGDFLSGGHLINQNNNELVNKDYLDKHYSLWKILRGEKNDNYVIEQLSKQLSKYNYELSENYELSYILEFLNRQCNYVINMQHSYDFLDLEWRVPLWDDDLIKFWLSSDFKMKKNQYLYSKILMDNNWSGLFNTIPINNPTNEIYPKWIVPFRNFTKLLFFITNNKSWRQFHQNVFWYFLDDAKNMALNSYTKVLFDFRGQRNDFSWIAEDYLNSLGVKNFIK